jgi:hypothetical protein
MDCFLDFVKLFLGSLFEVVIGNAVQPAINQIELLARRKRIKYNIAIKR